MMRLILALVVLILSLVPNSGYAQDTKSPPAASKDNKVQEKPKTQEELLAEYHKLRTEGFNLQGIVPKEHGPERDAALEAVVNKFRKAMAVAKDLKEVKHTVATQGDVAVNEMFIVFAADEVNRQLELAEEAGKAQKELVEAEGNAKTAKDTDHARRAVERARAKFDESKKRLIANEKHGQEAHVHFELARAGMKKIDPNAPVLGFWDVLELALTQAENEADARREKLGLPSRFIDK